jgi:hypothetical protein
MAGATAYLDKAIRLEDTLKLAGEHFKGALATYAADILAGMTTLNGTLSQIGGGRGGIDVVPGGGEADFGALSVGGFGATSRRSALLPSTPTGVHNDNRLMIGNLIIEGPDATELREVLERIASRQARGEVNTTFGRTRLGLAADMGKTA